jgi:uncharacterized protein (DUF1015 family)
MRFRPFAALRPTRELAAEVACPPYDVVDAAQARAIASTSPRSWMRVIRSEVDLPEGTDPYSDAVYARARDNFLALQRQGTLRRENTPAVYLYQQSLGGHTQTGVVATFHAGDYTSDVIKKHERTLKKKEDDRYRHVSTLRANTGPVFLMTPDRPDLDALLRRDGQGPDLFDFTAPDGVRHRAWAAADPAAYTAVFAQIPAAYIADGHHRAASTARVCADFAAANPGHTGEEPYNWFMAVCFPAGQLQILAYNRLVADLNGLTREAFLERVRGLFTVSPAARPKPAGAGRVHLFLGDGWHELSWPSDAGLDPVAALDVSILQNRLLAPVLGIDDPRTNPRIRFTGGFDAIERMEEDVRAGRAAAAFALHPVSVGEVMAVSDAGQIMPPKSTWFEPKLRSGLFVNTLDA